MGNGYRDGDNSKYAARALTSRCFPNRGESLPPGVTIGGNGESAARLLASSGKAYAGHWGRGPKLTSGS